MNPHSFPLRSVVSGVGSALPKRQVSNAELASQVDTTDEWIVERTGIRFIIDPRDPEIGHNHLPPCSAVPCRRLRFRNGIPTCRQFDICRD